MVNNNNNKFNKHRYVYSEKASPCLLP